MKFCGHCGKSIDEDIKYCPYCGKPNSKKKNMLLYFFLMVMIFIIFDIGSKLIYSSSFEIITLSKYGSYIILESIWALTVFIMLVWAGNSYIFRWKKVPIRKSLGLALPPVIIGILTFTFNFSNALAYNFIDVIGLLFYCITIGLTEEFLVRGWVLTEFIERYGFDYKHVKLSILASALIFGLMHLTNIFAGQTVFETLMQVIQTTGMGYLLGTVFYRTRNIWSVVFIHAFYDFSLMLTDINRYAVCTGTAQTENTLVTLVVSILLCVIYFALGEYNLRKTKTYNLLPEVKELTKKDIEDSKRTTRLCKLVVAISFVSIIVADYMTPEMETQVCKPYPTKEISGNYSIKEVYYKTYDFIEYGKTSLIYIKDGKFYKKNKYTNEEEVITSEKNDLIVLHNETNNILAYYDKENSKIHYEKYNFSISGNPIVIDYPVPKLEIFGVLELEDGEEHIFFTSKDIHYGIIDSDSQLYEVNFDD
jgi:membrane protease YdiL (CAAX protease family)